MALEKYYPDARNCMRCGYCRDIVAPGSMGSPIRDPFGIDGVCPVYHEKRFDHYTARGRMQIVWGLLDGFFDYSPALAEHAYTCCGCSACTAVCWADAEKRGEEGIKTARIMRAMRQDVVDMGLGPPEPLKARDALIDAQGNPFGKPKAERSNWAKGLGLPQKGELVFWAGCYAAYEYPEVAQAVVKTLRAAGSDVACLGDKEGCCGMLELWDGNRAKAKERAESNVKALAEAGAKRLVVSCAECYDIFKNDYPELVGALPFDVVHTSQLFAQLLDEGKLKLGKPVNKKVTYHDACYLSRHNGIYEEPRKLLSSIPGLELVETRRKEKYALCCGSGADMLTTAFPDVGLAIAKRRAEELKEAADIVVTGCPRCLRNIAEGAKAQSLDLTARDLAVVLAEALP